MKAVQRAGLFVGALLLGTLFLGDGAFLGDGPLGRALRAHAQDEPAGALGAHFLASPQEDIGALLNADLWFPFDWFRVGGFIGVGTIPSEEDARNRLYMPFGASLAVELMGDDVGFSVRARGGIWAGATQEVKLTAGGLVGGGAHLLIHLGGGTALNVGMDVYGLLGAGETFVFAPGVGLSWNPAFEDERDVGEP